MKLRTDQANMADLDGLFQCVMDELPLERDAALTLNASNCTRPPDEIISNRLKVVAWPLGHIYGDSDRHDVIHFFADKTTYRRLGLLLFASIFHPNRRIWLYPKHPESTVMKIGIECRVADPLAPPEGELASIPMAYGYRAEPPGHIHPLWREDWRISGRHQKYRDRASFEFPFFNLTDGKSGCANEDEFAKRNVIEGFGGPDATATLAALFLDIGLPQSALSELYLESPSGNWSVAIGSAEARLWVGYDFH